MFFGDYLNHKISSLEEELRSSPTELKLQDRVDVRQAFKEWRGMKECNFPFENIQPVRKQIPKADPAKARLIFNRKIHSDLIDGWDLKKFNKLNPTAQDFLLQYLLEAAGEIHNERSLVLLSNEERKRAVAAKKARQRNTKAKRDVSEHDLLQFCSPVQAIDGEFFTMCLQALEKKT